MTYGAEQKAAEQKKGEDAAPVAMQEFPCMVYLHPKDKTQEAQYKTINNAEELKAAIKDGWQLKAHVAQAPEDADTEPVPADKAGAKKG